ncbi:hypothetical protein LWI29_030467 [Acer saccharum]|uniref:Uncharacterized protein n=1 Tax=Acer saccharum TaxID=4024 RepID=A0AA39RT87_ACESA|nr:hypothetical protein LWI29_030467 [Acer saccharum]
MKVQVVGKRELFEKLSFRWCFYCLGSFWLILFVAWVAAESLLCCVFVDWLPGSIVFPFGVVSSLRGAVCIPFVLLAVWLFITLLFVEQIALDVSKFEKWRQRTITMFYGLMMKMMMVMVDMV